MKQTRLLRNRFTLIFDKDNSMRKDRPFNNCSRKIGSVFIWKNKSRTRHYTFHKNEQKLNQGFKCKHKTIKFLEENTGENHVDHRFGDILDITAKTKYIKEKC